MANQSGSGFFTVCELSCSTKVTVQQLSLSHPRVFNLTLITASNIWCQNITGDTEVRLQHLLSDSHEIGDSVTLRQTVTDVCP